MKSDYCLQQRQHKQNLGYNMYEHSQWGTPTTTAFPAAGSAPPSLMWRDALSANPIEIESSLFGIGSTNLVTPQKPVCPQLKQLPTIHFSSAISLSCQNHLFWIKMRDLSPSKV